MLRKNVYLRAIESDESADDNSAYGIITKIYKMPYTDDTSRRFNDKKSHRFDRIARRLILYYLENPFFPIKQQHTTINGLLLYINTLKCQNVFSQYTWAERPIILNPPFPVRMANSFSATLYEMLNEKAQDITRYKVIRALILQNLETIGPRKFLKQKFTLPMDTFNYFCDSIITNLNAKAVYAYMNKASNKKVLRSI